MGNVRMGPPREFVLFLKENLDLSIFIETGTFKGGTATWAANHFDTVYTIENSKSIFEEVSNTYQSVQNIEFIYGDSRTELKKIVGDLCQPALFWLDAHWCGMDSYGTDDQCPIIEELNILRSTKIPHYILIDDARLFLSPPPLPNSVDQWPTIELVLYAIQDKDMPYYTIVFEDVIIGVPSDARALVAKFCQTANTKAWENHVGIKSQKSKAFDLFKQGTLLLVRDIRRNFKTRSMILNKFRND